MVPTTQTGLPSICSLGWTDPHAGRGSTGRRALFPVAPRTPTFVHAAGGRPDRHEPIRRVERHCDPQFLYSCDLTFGSASGSTAGMFVRRSTSARTCSGVSRPEGCAEPQRISTDTRDQRFRWSRSLPVSRTATAKAKLCVVTVTLLETRTNLKRLGSSVKGAR